VAGSAELRAGQHRTGVHRQPAACDGLAARKQALDERLSRVARDPEFWPLVSRLRAFRGLDTLSALIIVLEVADFQRFARAVQLGSWLGLVPSRQQSGESDTHGSITKTGSRYARRILVEAAWDYTRPPRIGTTLAERHDGLPDHILQIALARAAPPAPHPQADARTQEARQR
jgi:transposase